MRKTLLGGVIALALCVALFSLVDHFVFGMTISLSHVLKLTAEYSIVIVLLLIVVRIQGKNKKS